MGIDGDAIFSIVYHSGESEAWRAKLINNIADARRGISDPKQGIDSRIATIDEKVRRCEEELQARAEGSEDLMRKAADLTQRRDYLLGDVANPGCLRGAEALAAELKAIPEAEDRARGELREGFLQAHRAAMSIFAIQKEAYSDATAYVASHSLARQVGLEFDVELRIKGFTASWCDIVNKQRLSDLHAVFENPNEESLLEGVNLASAEEVFTALLKLQDRIGRERGNRAGARRALSSVVRASYSASDLLLAMFDLKWLEGEYVIRSSGRSLVSCRLASGALCS